MSRHAYLPIAVELPSRKGVTFEVLPAGTFNRVTVYQRTRAGLRRVAAAPKRKAPTPPPPRLKRAALLGLAVFAVLLTVAIRGCMP